MSSYRLILLTLLASSIKSACVHAAPIILDDFTESAELVYIKSADYSIPTVGDERIFTSDVGDLEGTRGFFMMGLGGGRPLDGSMDANLSQPGKLSFKFNALDPRYEGGAIAAHNWNYYFPAVDISHGGENDAIFVEFDSFQSTSSLAFGVYVRDTAAGALGLTLYGRVDSLPNSDDPFTVRIPFDALTSRSGSEWPYPVRNVEVIEFDLRHTSLPPQGQWEGSISRIWIGSSQIPEPSSLAGAIALVLFSLAGRKSIGRF